MVLHLNFLYDMWCNMFLCIMHGFYISVCVLGILEYSDDTAMARCVVQSLLTRAGFDEQDMARRYSSAHCRYRYVLC